MEGRESISRPATWTNTRIAELLAEGAAIDAFGVGTALATPGDAPHLNLIYKLVEVERDGKVREAAKLTQVESHLSRAANRYSATRGKRRICGRQNCARERAGKWRRAVARRSDARRPARRARRARHRAARAMHRRPRAASAALPPDQPRGRLSRPLQQAAQGHRSKRFASACAALR